MYHELPNKIQNDYRNKGKQRAECERKLLITMFNGFSKLTLRQNLDEAIYLNKECELQTYTDLTKADLENGFASLSPDGKHFYYLLVGLDALVERGLLSKEVYVFYKTDGSVSRISDTCDMSEFTWLFIASALVTKDENAKDIGTSNQLRFHSVHYKLTEKGYDVALILMKHLDESTRFEQQTALNSEAVDTSKSAAKIARRALIAAAAIAIGSLGSLVINIYQVFCQP